MQEAQFRGVALRVAVPDECRAFTDPQLVEQIVDNLLINAFKHAAASCVTLSLRESEGRALIEVADDGRGIAETDRVRVFGKFSVAQNSHRGVGTGLGLWIVRQLSTALDGAITLQSGPDSGSVFKLDIPLSVRTDK